MKSYLNGELIDHADAMVSVDDAGFTHAVGLFETMQAFHGCVFRLREHLKRLDASSRELGLARELDLDELAGAVERTLAANELPFARIRLTVTAGEVSLLRSAADEADATPAAPAPPTPTVLITAAPPTAYDPAYFTQGVTVIIAPPAANPFDPTQGHKVLNYWHRLRTLRQASAAGAGEAIWMSVSNHLASGAVSNVFLVKDEVLLTPIVRGEEVEGGLPAPVLPGITRAAVLEIAASLDIEVDKRMLSIDDLLDADEVFLTNSSWLVLPVANVEKHRVGSGRVGKVTDRLRQALGAMIEKECGTGE